MTDADLDRLLRETLSERTTDRRVPASTYRLQFHKGFTFRDATAIVPYLHALGVTHVYASPYLKAMPGSTHGYDVVDHTRLNDELGTRDDYDAFCDALAEHGMGQILDTVPNHMGVSSDDNAQWNELLRTGHDGPAGRFFDVAWDESPRPALKRKILLPVLGESYGDALEGGKLKLVSRDGATFVEYYDRHFPINEAIDDLDRYNRGDADGTDALDELLSRQHYRLACWKTASDEINFRRFFDVTSLAAVAMERPEVFEHAHALTLSLMAEGRVQGLRIDHSDGLLDPAAYFLRLQRETLVACAMHRATSKDAALRERLRDRVQIFLPDDYRGPWPLYLVTEKILAPGEPLPRWAIDGTSGYDVLNEINGLFVDGAGAATLEAVYRDVVPDDSPDYEVLAYEKKRQTLITSFAGELNLLTRQLDRLAQADRHTRDFTFAKLHDALATFIASFDVYRTYVADAGPGETDADVVGRAAERATRRSPRIDAAIFAFMTDAMLFRGPYANRLREPAVRFAARCQQLTSPVTAKGLEDCAFYIYHRLISVNEVGGEPSRAGVTRDELHGYFAARQRDWPAAMSVLSTHDTKRSEDVRARINVLSELPDEWSQNVRGWMCEIGDVHPNDAYLLFQTLIGAWQPPDGDFVDRIDAYMQKALREAKLRTSWTMPNEAVEAAMSELVRRLLDPERGAAFQSSFDRFAQRVAAIGRVSSLAQTVLRLTAPGVPDTYQGTELLDFSLVDPDNRRPVDYALRERLLASLDSQRETDVSSDASEATAKLLVTSRLLRLRRERPTLFRQGDYAAVDVTGEGAGNVFAFTRTHGDQTLLVAVPRLVARHLSDDERIHWGNTQMRIGGEWRNVFTGEHVAASGLSTMLGKLPVGAWMRTA